MKSSFVIVLAHASKELHRRKSDINCSFETIVSVIPGIAYLNDEDMAGRSTQQTTEGIFLNNNKKKLNVIKW